MGDLRRYHLVSLGRPHGGWLDLQAVSTRARLASEQVSAEGHPVRFLRSIFVPDDDACFYLFEGTADAVAEAGARAGLTIKAVFEAVDATPMTETTAGPPPGPTTPEGKP